MTNTRSLTFKRANNGISLREALTLSGDPALSAIEHTLDAGQSWDFDGTTGPAVTKWWHGLVTLTAGAASLDLTALTDAATGLTIDMTGLKLKCLHLQATTGNAGDITFKPGGTNGLTGWIGAGGEVLAATDQRGPNVYTGGIAVDATHKTIDVTGTGTDSIRVVMLFG